MDQLEKSHLYYSDSIEKYQKGDFLHMTEMRQTRPTYPADRKTFVINKEKLRDKTISTLSLHFRSSERYHVNVVLEDTQRNGSIIFLNKNKIYNK